MINRFAAIIVASLVAGRAVAQTAPPAGSRIDFDQAVKIALQQSTTIRQAKNANALGATGVRQQQLDFLPDLRVTTSGANSIGRTFSQTDGQLVDEATQSLNAGLSSSVTIFDGLRNVAELRGAKLEQDATEQELARARQTVVFTVAANFLALVTQQEQLGVQRENLAALEAQQAQVEQYVKAGTRPNADLWSQQAAVAAARASVVDAERALELAKVDIMGTLQLDPRGTYEFVAPEVGDARPAAEQYDLGALLDRALRQRQDVDAEESRVAAAGQDVKAAGAAKLPTVSLSAGYNTGYSTASDLALQDQLDQRRGGSVSIGVSVPLFDRGAASLAEQRARIQEDNARVALDAKRQSVALEIRRAYLDYNAAQQRLVAAEAQRAASAQAVAASQARYQAGVSPLLEVTQARAALVQAEAALVSARSNLILQRTVMSYYTGDLDPARATLPA